MTLRNGQSTATTVKAMRRNVSQLGSDVITLVELQTELLQVDLREWATGFVRSPVLLISVGYFISQASDLSLGVSMLIAAGIGILVAAVFAGLGVWMLRREQGMLHRFRRELKHNITWLKHVLSSPAETTAARPTYSSAQPVS
jgi:uncharacterized membrane-anchored protein